MSSGAMALRAFLFKAAAAQPDRFRCACCPVRVQRLSRRRSRTVLRRRSRVRPWLRCSAGTGPFPKCRLPARQLSLHVPTGLMTACRLPPAGSGRPPGAAAHAPAAPLLPARPHLVRRAPAGRAARRSRPGLLLAELLVPDAPAAGQVALAGGLGPHATHAAAFRPAQRRAARRQGAAGCLQGGGAQRSRRRSRRAGPLHYTGDTALPLRCRSWLSAPVRLPWLWSC